MRRSPCTRLLAASVAALATVAFASCGGDDDDAVTTDAPGVTMSTTVDETVGDTTPDVTMAPDVTTPTSDTSVVGSTPSSGGGEVGSQDDYIEAAKGEFDFADDDINTCVAEAAVADDVYAAIQDAGVTVDQFRQDGPVNLGIDEERAGQMADDFAACGDLASQFSADADQTELDCLEQNLDNHQLAEVIAFSILALDPSAEVAAARDAVQPCIDAATTSTT